MKTLFCLLLVVATAMAGEQPSMALKLETSTPLPDVKGRFDHFAMDVVGQRLFVAALGNDTVEVLDAKAHKRLRTLSGCSKPQGLVYLPGPNLLFVANGGDGSVRVYDGASFKPIATIGALDDADNLRFDAKANLVYVGYGNGALGVINPATRVLTAGIKLPGHPESFQMERNGDRVFVNVPDARRIVVLDRQTREQGEAWSLPNVQANFPMALDEAGQRLFVGCRRPPRLVVLNTADGKTVAELPIAGDTDDLFYDAERKRIYASCGEGYLDVIQQTDAGGFKELEKIMTSPGARTSFFAPELNRFYLAVPRRGGNSAEIRIYDIGR